MRRINAVGYYGWDNFGDELFRAAVQHNRELIWGRGTEVRCFVTPIRALHQNIGPVGGATRYMEMLLGVLWADTIALCGGSVLEDVRGTQQSRAKLAKARHRIEGLGVSLGPWASDDAKQRVQRYMQRMDRVVVRDRASRDRVGSSVTLGGDLAALYPMPTVPSPERKHLTICISKDSRSTADALVHLLAGLLRDVEMPVKLLALNVRKVHGDVEMTHEVRRRLLPHHQDIEVLQYESIDQTIDVIARSKAVWSQRLHGLIVGYLCEVPILALSHHRKISDFASHIGLAERFLRETLELDDTVLAAAAESVTALPSWTVTPEDYKRRTAAAMASRQGRDEPAHD